MFKPTEIKSRATKDKKVGIVETHNGLKYPFRLNLCVP